MYNHTVEIMSWVEIGTVMPQGNDCEQIGIYDAANDVIQIFGGRNPFAQYTFDIANENFTYQNTSALSRGIAVSTATAWQYFNDTIYYQISGSGVIRQLNIHTLADTQFATLNNTQTGPGICIDESTGTIYSVGGKEIEACTSTGTCTTILKDQQYLEDDSGAALQEMACSYYDGRVYTFGGIAPPADPVDAFPVTRIFECLR